ncbi:(-)-germacrene D synthase [Morus notabilis]|uniref:(-)-germacrene D synthase n=1 Tax=Morus notabilis TaxID=981085 RepID=W9SED9_9ROSA|nr:(-)-germacrene D synthase [Morus notabilis]
MRGHKMKQQVQAYFDEAKWLNANYIPTVEEHMKVAALSGGYRMFTKILQQKRPLNGRQIIPRLLELHRSFVGSWCYEMIRSQVFIHVTYTHMN